MNVKFISYRELMIYYGISARSAKNMINGIRFALGKKRDNRVHIQEFCNYENVDRSVFEAEIEMEFRKFQQNDKKIV